MPSFMVLQVLRPAAFTRTVAPVRHRAVLSGYHDVVVERTPAAVRKGAGSAAGRRGKIVPLGLGVYPYRPSLPKSWSPLALVPAISYQSGRREIMPSSSHATESGISLKAIIQRPTGLEPGSDVYAAREE